MKIRVIRLRLISIEATDKQTEETSMVSGVIDLAGNTNPACAVFF